MSAQIEVSDNSGEKVAVIEFNGEPASLNMQPTATGFNLSLPIKLTLKVVGSNEPLPMLSNLLDIGEN